jgi:predicted P-loop ATPase
VQFGDWRSRLLRTEKGKLRSCYDNVGIMFENAPEWAGVLGYNEFTGGLVFRKPPPPPVTGEVGTELEDRFDTEAVRWLEGKGLMVTPDMVRRVVDAVARRNSYHPVRAYLGALRLPYGHRVVEIPRQNVFVGTTNSDCGCAMRREGAVFGRHAAATSTSPASGEIGTNFGPKRFTATEPA